VLYDYVHGYNVKVAAVGGSSGASHALWCAATGTPPNYYDKLDACVACFSGDYEMYDTNSMIWDGEPSSHRPSLALNLIQRPTSALQSYLDDLNTSIARLSATIAVSGSGTNEATKLAAASPIDKLVSGSIPPLYFISTSIDHITPYQYGDLKDKLDGLNVLNYKALYLTDDRVCGGTNQNGHSFQY
jgi:hypothetical protein